MSPTVLKTIQGENFESRVFLTKTDNGLGKIFYVADLDIDCDGPNGNPDKDPYWQSETTLQHEGKSIDSYQVKGVVVPLWLPSLVKPVVLGCQAYVTNLTNGLRVPAVVYDLGPSKKNGEGSCRLAAGLGINPSPKVGGEDEPCILYEIFPGIPAIVDSVFYKLQPYK